jgi:hypothetical protein
VNYGQECRRLSDEIAALTGEAPFIGIECPHPGRPRLYLLASGGPERSGEAAVGRLAAMLAQLRAEAEITSRIREELSRVTTRDEAGDYRHATDWKGRP